MYNINKVFFLEVFVSKLPICLYFVFWVSVISGEFTAILLLYQHTIYTIRKSPVFRYLNSIEKKPQFT